jgi:hypothetical protein
MNNLGSTLARIAAFAGGAFAGALLTGWLDKLIVARTQEQPATDSSRYAQGLQPHSQPPSGKEY